MLKIAKTNFKEHFYIYKHLIIILSLAGLQYWLLPYKHNISIITAFVIDIIFSIFNTFILKKTRDKNTLQNYLIFNTTAKIIGLFLVLLSRDFNKMLNVSNLDAGLYKNFIVSITIIAGTYHSGFAMLNGFLIFLLLCLYGIHRLDSVLTKKVHKPNSRKIWYITYTFFTILFIYGVLHFVNLLTQIESESAFNVIIADSAIADDAVTHTLFQTIYNVTLPILSFAWLPLLLLINRYRNGNFFLNKNVEFFICSQTILLLNYLNLMVSHKILLYIPIILVILILYKVLPAIILVFKTIRENNKNVMNDNYVPLLITKDFDENITMIHIWEKRERSREKKLEKKERRRNVKNKKIRTKRK